MISLPIACLSSYERTARWHTFLSLLHSTLSSSDKYTICFSLLISDRKVVRTHLIVHAIGKSLGAPSTLCSGTHTHFHRSLLTFAHKGHQIHFLLDRKDLRRWCATIAHCVVRQNISAQVHHSDVRGQSGYKVTCIWVALRENADRMKLLLVNLQRCSNHVFLLEQLKITRVGKAPAQTEA